MTYEELLGWFSYFEQRPYGWREDDRAMKYLQTQGVKEKPWMIFSSLGPIYNPVKEDKGFDAKSFINSSFFSQMLSADGGETIKYD